MKNKKMIKAVSIGVTMSILVGMTSPVWAFTKQETVYSKVNDKGENYETIVSSRLTNNEKNSVLEDISKLVNIKNTNGEETYEQNGDNLTWNSNGNTIYYQGETKKEPPISCKVSYFLDGNEISASDLAGKSGKVKMVVEYSNNDGHTVDINGSQETLYTPFVVVAGTILDDNKLANVSVSNGKVINDGQRTIAIGIALPGMQESLGLNKEELEIPNSITIEGDATDFEMSNIMSVITPKVLETEDLDELNKLDTLYDQIDMLQKSSNQLAIGAHTLKQGTQMYYQKSKEFNRAMKTLGNGVNSASANYSKIADGIEQINSNTDKLHNGSEQIKQGSKQVEESIGTITNKLDALEQGSATLKVEQKKIVDGVNEIASMMNKNKGDMTKLPALIENGQQTINALKSTPGISEEIIKALQANLDAEKKLLQNTQTLAEKLPDLKQGVEGIYDGSIVVNEGVSKLNVGTKTLLQATKKLTAGAEELYTGTDTLTAGANQLAAGSTQMEQGLVTLNSGTKQLQNADNQLLGGAHTLEQGASNLELGMKTFNEEGIKKIANVINGEVKDMQEKVEQLQQLANEYNNFSGLSNNSQGEVKFIMLIDGIKQQ